MKNIEKEINLLKERNKRVELDKAWETSWTRIILIFIFTYIIIVVFFYLAELPDPFINSIVPALGFVISTLTLPFFKKRWIERRK